MVAASRGWRWWAGVLVGALATLAVCAVAFASRRSEPRSTVIYPEQSLPLRFFHDRHLKLGLRCELCHVAAPAGETPADSLLPGHQQCQLCHQITSPNAGALFPPASCDTCHLGFTGTPQDLEEKTRAPARAVIPAANLNFSHRRHVDRGVDCRTCHQGVEGVGLATRAQLPSMTTCLSCHDGRRAPGECATCHLSASGGTLVRHLPGASGPLVPVGRFLPDDHRDARWGEEHRAAARSGPATCAACHDTSFCERCHDGALKPAVHPNDWVMTHGQEALVQGLKCQSCHDTRTFCQSCHSTAGITPETFPGATAGGGLRFHPRRWADTEVGPDHHGIAARREPSSCAACHTGDEARCVQCHGTQVNPHGPGFGQSGRARELARTHPEMCLTCHPPGTLDLLGGR